ncbi:helix-turn-helix transcriptional regulator [Salmonella enterica subsp. enterica]|nr:XRE family transcriptional regulator [Salmonella enterica subsp. enterica serovar Mikawasima]HCP9898292.1 helix-turn-helix transcriptional regulator [Salmonella enterica]EBR0172658.1 XRE family transcriptional regulator [Salmonella enterica subsp. enterica serovar Mikawasima]EBS3158099.1 XRE family transcriptional regulator [Salmonella enterica subsp. enterica serovar Mikawasima]EDW0319806.1 helix-turn-helix transcriptional regulator [Salmonella enterica subsp. enterica serovar Mikawasima]
MSVGENLKRLRRDKGWTQGELAAESNIGLAQISKIEKDKTDPKLSTIYQLINALGCTADALLVDIEKSSIDSVMAMALDRIKQLPEKDKEILLTLIDKYCIAVSMQLLADRKDFFGTSIIKGKTPEMTKPDK